MAVTRRSRTSRPRSPSSTDLFYDERPRRRWALVLGIAAFAVIGGTIAFALTRGRSTEHVVAQGVIEPPSATAPVDTAPSKIIATEPSTDTAAASAAAGAKDDAGKAANSKPAAVVRRPPDSRAPVANPPAPSRQPATPRQPPASVAPPSTTRFPVPGSEPTRRAPGAELSAPSPSPSGPTPPQRSTAPALTDGPRDPYGPDDTSGDGAPPEKKAEFFANLGSQQLIGGDTAGAAANFKKAAELDSKNVAATSGLGEIALRQGLFGDAIAHLSKASKLAPRNPKVLTLLGEAYLNSGNNQQAAAQFKKALQIDPDNARARDGYNEASSRVPPPDDDTP
jgi:TolA-binding protein